MAEARSVLVSGGSRGLGAALVRSFLDSGCRVATFARNRTEAVEACTAAHGDRYRFESLDAADSKSLRAFALGVGRAWGGLDVLVNNAAVAPEGVFTMMTGDDVGRTLTANLEAAILLTQACIKIMLHAGRGGAIVNVSSVNGLRGNRGVAVYGATKAALDGLTRNLAREFGSRGIRVNSVAPGYLATDMTRDMPEKTRDQVIRRTPLGRLGQVDDVVGVVRFLTSEAAAFVTGQTLVVDGGLTC